MLMRQEMHDRDDISKAVWHKSLLWIISISSFIRQEGTLLGVHSYI